jgi:hypothetical protein
MSKPQKAKAISSLKQDIEYTANIHDYQFNTMKLSPDLEQELKEKDLAWRFINMTQLKKNGHHRGFWKPYQRTSKPEKDSPSVKLFGNDPDGYIIRGDAILAVKPKAEADRFRSLLQKRTQILAGQARSSSVAERLREELGADLGSGSTIKDLSEDED